MFNVSTWARQLLVDVPQRLFHDNALRLAFGIFWGVFILSGMLSYARPEYAERVVSKEVMAQMEEMYAEPVEGRTSGMGAMMFGFYTFNNPGIGLRCFAMGLLFGIGGLFIRSTTRRFWAACSDTWPRRPRATTSSVSSPPTALTNSPRSCFRRRRGCGWDFRCWRRAA